MLPLLFFVLSLFSFHLQLFLKKKKKKITYSSCINLVLCLSLNWVQFLYSKKATKPTLLALKTSPAFIIKPPENFIPTRKPKSLSQTGNPVVIIKVSNHLNPHLSHIIIDPPRERKKNWVVHHNLLVRKSYNNNHN